jgi:hypothetical protein
VAPQLSRRERKADRKRTWTSPVEEDRHARPATVLVVADRTADSEELRAVLVERCERGPIEITLLASAAWEVTDPPGGTESARRRLRAAMTRLGAGGIAARGVVGDANPVPAVERMWDAERFDEVIVSTLPAHLSRWLGIDLPHRGERITGRPARHVIASEQAAAVET